MNLIRFELEYFKARSPLRGEDYLREALSAGTIDGAFISWPAEVLEEIRSRHPVKRGIEGLGDVVALAAKPIARGIDVIFGTDLENCGGCADRQAWLNKQFQIG